MTAPRSKKLATYSHVVVSWIGDDGFPVQTPAEFTVDPDAGSVHIHQTGLALPTDRTVNVVASHIHPNLDTATTRGATSRFGERSRPMARGSPSTLSDTGAGMKRSHRSPSTSSAPTPQARRYLDELSRSEASRSSRGSRRSGPFFLATRFSFLTPRRSYRSCSALRLLATTGEFNLWLALVTILAGAAIHIGLPTLRTTSSTPDRAPTRRITGRRNTAAARG